MPASSPLNSLARENSRFSSFWAALVARTRCRQTPQSEGRVTARLSATAEIINGDEPSSSMFHELRDSFSASFSGVVTRKISACCRARFLFFFQAEDGIRDYKVTGVQTCALPI